MESSIYNCTDGLSICVHFLSIWLGCFRHWWAVFDIGGLFRLPSTGLLFSYHIFLSAHCAHMSIITIIMYMKAKILLCVRTHEECMQGLWCSEHAMYSCYDMHGVVGVGM